MISGWTLSRSEKAVATVRPIRDTCKKHRIFDQLYTDNGSAFAGYLVAGGNVHRFGNAGKKREGIQPLGVCHHLGIRPRFALPANAQAKIAERIFADLSRVVDDRPEFKGAHAGHNPGASPNTDVRPIRIDTARQGLAREIERYDAEPGRRAQGARGRSYAQVFAAGIADRIVRRPTARQLYLAGLIYTGVAVDRNGRMRADGWTYGDPLTMDELLPYHGSGRRVLLGRDPDDLSHHPFR